MARLLQELMFWSGLVTDGYASYDAASVKYVAELGQSLTDNAQVTIAVCIVCICTCMHQRNNYGVMIECVVHWAHTCVQHV